MLYVIFRGIVKGTPRVITLVGMILFMFGLCPAVLLAGQEDIFNAMSIVFYSVALLAFILALFKYVTWRRSGLIRPLPVLQLDHVTGEETRHRVLLGVRETATYGKTQPVVFTPPASGSQRVSVICRTCQQEMVFQVDSTEQFNKRRLRKILIWGGGLLLSIVLGIISTYAGQTKPMALWVYLVWYSHAILFFCSAGGILALFVYIGAKAVRLYPGHRVRFPEKNELAILYNAPGAAINNQ
jgi:hypothetical protein